MPFYRCAAVIDLRGKDGRPAWGRMPKPDPCRSADPDIPEWAREDLTVRLADHVDWLLDREPPEERREAIGEIHGLMQFMGLIWEDFEVPTDQGALIFTDAAIRGNNLLALRMNARARGQPLLGTTTVYELLDYLSCL